MKRARQKLLLPHTSRGFTLVELMVVVIIIAILAVIAVPSVARRMRDRRTVQAASELTNVYRSARMRAMGRGSAVLVRWQNGTLEVREAVRGSSEPTANCQRLPISSCLSPDWNNADDFQVIETFDASKRAGSDVQVELTIGGTAQVTNDVCFTPMGRAYSRAEFDLTLTTLNTVPEARIWRKDASGAAVGLMRTVLVLPNGSARLGTSRPRT